MLRSHDQHFDNLDNAGRALPPRPTESWQQWRPRPGLVDGPRASIRGAASAFRCPWPHAARDRNACAAWPSGIEPVSGDVAGFALTLGDGPAIHICGDTVWYDGVAEAAWRFNVKAAILFTCL